MTKKVKLAIFDEDLKARTVGHYEVTDGNQIRVKSGGEAHFMPHFDNYSYLEFPRRSLLPPFKTRWDRIYIVRKGAKQCVNFKTEKVEGPDPQLVKDAAAKIMLDKLGDQEEPTPLSTWVTIALLVLIFLIQLGVINV